MKLSHYNSVQAVVSLDSKVKFIQFYFVSVCFFFIDMKFKLIDLSQTKNKIEVQV